MAEGQNSYTQTNTIHVAEDFLRRTVRIADDPFLAISESYRKKGHKSPIHPMQLEDEEEK